MGGGINTPNWMHIELALFYRCKPVENDTPAFRLV